MTNKELLESVRGALRLGFVEIYKEGCSTNKGLVFFGEDAPKDMLDKRELEVTNQREKGTWFLITDQYQGREWDNETLDFYRMRNVLVENLEAVRTELENIKPD